MNLVARSAIKKCLLTCVLVQPLSNVGGNEPPADVARGPVSSSVQLIAAGQGDEPRPPSGDGSYGAVTDFDARLSTGVHPLRPILELARDTAARIADEVEDYTCTLVKRERIGNRLLPPETIFAKVRHAAPRGDSQVASDIYLRFEAPLNLHGREILFPCTGDNDHLLVRNGGQRLAFMTLQLTPTCPLAMRGNRYPVTDFGIERLVQRMIHLGEQELVHQECEVSIQDSLRVADRSCHCIQILHPVRREHFAYHLARIYVDDGLQLPIRFEAYDWPRTEGGEPVLVEDYTYRDLHLNVGLTDDDFRRDNPAYQFSDR